MVKSSRWVRLPSHFASLTVAAQCSRADASTCTLENSRSDDWTLFALRCQDPEAVDMVVLRDHQNIGEIVV